MNDRDVEKARFFEVTGDVDDTVGNGTPVLFNPSSLKITLANSLKETERSRTNSAAQFVEKSSSSLAVELIFDTTDLYSAQGVDADVRVKTGAIANEFMQQAHVGDKHYPPKRCMFAWGTFCFVGIMESFDETLDYFSSEGAPLRSTVSIKMTESRYQFRSRDAETAERETPNMSRASDSATDANANAGNDPKGWRDTSMFNGLESPRMPSMSALAVPSLSASASFGASVQGGVGLGTSASIGGGASFGGGASIGGGVSAGFSTGVSAGLSTGVSTGSLGGSSLGFSTGVSTGVSVGSSVGISSSANFNTSVSTQFSSSVQLTPPAFKYGASASLGTGIPGAFSTNTKVGSGFSAGSIIAAKSATKNQATAKASVSVNSAGVSARANIGFD